MEELKEIELQIFEKLQGIECELFYASQANPQSKSLEQAAALLKELLPVYYRNMK